MVITECHLVRYDDYELSKNGKNDTMHILMSFATEWSMNNVHCTACFILFSIYWRNKNNWTHNIPFTANDI